MRIRLSTSLLLVAVLAVCLAWYVDRVNSNKTAIVGAWYYPSPLVSVLGYREVLTIRDDGSFTKEHRHRTFLETYSGHYNVLPNGLVVFHIVKKEPDSASMANDDLDIECACGFDQSGNLLIQPTNELHLDHGNYSAEFDGLPIEWQIYSPMSPQQQHEADIAKLEALIGEAK